MDNKIEALIKQLQEAREQLTLEKARVDEGKGRELKSIYRSKRNARMGVPAGTNDLVPYVNEPGKVGDKVIGTPKSIDRRATPRVNSPNALANLPADRRATPRIPEIKKEDLDKNANMSYDAAQTLLPLQAWVKLIQFADMPHLALSL